LKNHKNAYLKITKIFNIIKVLDILLMAEISEYVNIAIRTFIACEYIVVRYYYNLFTIPNLQRNNTVEKSQNLDLSNIAYTENDNAANLAKLQSSYISHDL